MFRCSFCVFLILLLLLKFYCCLLEVLIWKINIGKRSDQTVGIATSGNKDSIFNRDWTLELSQFLSYISIFADLRRSLKSSSIALMRGAKFSKNQLSHAKWSQNCSKIACNFTHNCDFTPKINRFEPKFKIVSFLD